MKLSVVYQKKKPDYTNFVEELVTKVNCEFNNQSYSTRTSIKLKMLLKQEITNYIRQKYKKEYTLCLQIIYPGSKIIQTRTSNPLILNLRLPEDVLRGVLEGTIEDSIEHISYLVDQAETEIKAYQKLNILNYLLSDIQGMAEISYFELISNFSNDEIKLFLKNKDGWEKIKETSVVFNDFYSLYKENKTYKEHFLTFLRFIFLKCHLNNNAIQHNDNK